MTRQDARQLGAEHGQNAGSWIIDGNTSQADAEAIIRGYDDGDPEIMDMCPSPLSGEWADDLTPQAFDNDDELMTEYEQAYVDAFWGEVLRSAKAVSND